MRVHRSILSLFFFLFFVAYTLPADAAIGIGEVSVTKGEGPVDIEADELIYERETQLYQAHGQVEVYRGDLSLKADHAQLNMETKYLVAWGNVLLREGEDVIECQRLEVNLETRLGKIQEARLFLKEQNFHITGKEAEKLGENHYRIRDGSLTTCDAKRPPWKFLVKELEVKEMAFGGWGIAKGAIFHLEDIPVLYFPWGTFPVRQERQTGFLIPQVGYSNQYGPEVKTGFYWAFAKDMDATFYFDYLGDRGFKEGLEYRYALTQETKGQANFYFIDDQVLDKNRYAFFVQHQQKLPYDFYLKGDIYYASDNQYLYDFNEDFQGVKIDSRSSRQLRSVLFGGKNWDQFSFIVDNEFFDNLTQTNNDETVQILPQISFYAHPQSLFKTPLFYEFTSSYTNFWRQEGVEAHRVDLLPRLSYPMRLFNVLKLESFVGLRETLYYPYNDPTGTFHGWKSRETLEAGMEMSTEFYRIYDGRMFSKISDLYKVSKWMHTIEPTLIYIYSPRVNQDDLPVFDEVDRIPYSNEITYGVTQRLIGKPEKEGILSGPFEYAKLKIYQSYSLGDPYIDSEGKKRSFSKIKGELWWNFGPYVSAQLDTEFNPYQGSFDRFNFLIKANDRRNDAVRVQFRNTKGNVKMINFDARVKTINPLYIFGGIRYNLLDHYNVVNTYGVEYQAQCWSSALVVESWGQPPNQPPNQPFNETRKKELKVNFYFNLLNIGSVGHKPYAMNL